MGLGKPVEEAREIESARLDEVRRYAGHGGLDAALQDVVSAAAAACRTPVALVQLVGGDVVTTAASVGASPPPLPRDQTFCNVTIRADGLLVVRDAKADPRFAHIAPVAAGWRSYAGAPLVTPAGYAIGTLCVLDRKPRKLGAAALEALEGLARLAMTRLEVRRMSALVVGNDDGGESLPVEVAALKARQDRYQSLLDSTGEGIFYVDLEGRCTFANAACARMLGYDDANELLGASMHDLIHHSRPDGRPYPADECETMRALRKGAPLRVDGETFWRRDGSPFAAECWLSPVEQNGRIVGGVLAFIDVTGRKRDEEAARRSLRIRERFLGILAHDLRGPLNAIKLGAAAIKSGAEPTRVARQIGSAADRMDRLIGQLLDFARSRGDGRIPIVRKSVDLGRVCRDVVAEVRAGHPGSQVVIDTRGDLVGDWDPDRLGQVVANLVSNALHHGSPGMPVYVAAHDQGGEVTLSVHNKGPAIPSDRLARIFEPFERGTTSARDGLGLGLFIVRAIVASHGGVIEVRSTPDEGTTFTVALRRQSAGQSAQALT